MSEETYYLSSVILGGLALAVAVVTLVFLWKYTRAAEATAAAAAEQAKAAFRQTESQRTPVLVLHTINLSGAASTRFGGRDVDIQPYLPDGAIGVMNIGNGSALNVQANFYEVRNGARPRFMGRLSRSSRRIKSWTPIFREICWRGICRASRQPAKASAAASTERLRS